MRHLQFDFGPLTHEHTVAPDPGIYPPIGNVLGPSDVQLPLVAENAGVDVPIVPLLHPRLQVLSAYWKAGWVDSGPGAWMREPAAEALYEAVSTLPEGWGLAVFDAWRPHRLQYGIYKAAYSDPTLPPGFVTEPSRDPTTPPPHTTGGTVDVTLTWRGQPLALGTVFDDFTEEAHTLACEEVPDDGPEDHVSLRDMRRMLFHAMTGAGFVGYPMEWWHFEVHSRLWAAVTGNEPMYGAVSPYDTPVAYPKHMHWED